MTAQAKCSLDLYSGGNPSTIEKLLGFQSSSVVNELRDYFGVNNNHDLAISLSMN